MKGTEGNLQKMPSMNSYPLYAGSNFMHYSCLWSYDSWIYNYLWNQYLLPLKLWVWIPLMARCTWYNNMWFVTGRWFSLGTPVSFTNKTDCHDITEILLKVVLNTTNLTQR